MERLQIIEQSFLEFCNEVASLLAKTLYALMRESVALKLIY